MERSRRKHERSLAKLDAVLPRKKPRGFKRPSGSLEALAAAAAAAATAAEGGSEPRCDAEGRVLSNCNASGREAEPNPIGAHALEPDEPPGFSHCEPTGVLHQDDADEGKCHPRVVLPKNGGSRLRTEAGDSENMPLEYSEDRAKITVDREDLSKPPCSIPLFQEDEAVQLASTLVNERVKEFIAGLSEPGVLHTRLSKLISILVQAASITSVLHDRTRVNMWHAEGANRTRILELEQQVQELTGKVHTIEDELEATKVMLRGTRAAMLEAQSDRVTTIATMNTHAMLMGASFARLGTVLDPPPNVAHSLDESVKQLTALVSLVVPVSHNHAASLARSSLTFGVTALLCRARGVESLHDPLAGDSRLFIRSQGPEFHSVAGQVVHAIEQESVEALQGGSRGCEETKTQQHRQT